MIEELDVERVLKAAESGEIDLSDLQQKVELKKKREELLSRHPWSIWQGQTNGLWYTYLPCKDARKGRKLCTSTTRKGLEDKIVRYWEKEGYNPTIMDAFNEWNQNSLDNEDIEHATYERNQREFNRYYKEFGKRRIKSVTAKEFSDFLKAQIHEYQLNSKSFNNLKSVTRGMLEWALDKDLIGFSPTQMLGDIKISKKKFKQTEHDDSKDVFNLKERELMLQYLKGHPNIHNLGILLDFVTGLRPGELTTLKWDCVTDNAVTVKYSETSYRDEELGKNVTKVQDHPKTAAGFRTVAIPPDYQWVIAALREKNPTGEYVLMQNGKRIKRRAINTKLQRNCKKLGISPKTAYAIRKTYASILMNNQVDERMIRDQMGHTNVNTTENFYHKNMKDINDKIAILSGIPEFQDRSRMSLKAG